jgi:hypothetical protein
MVCITKLNNINKNFYLNIILELIKYRQYLIEKKGVIESQQKNKRQQKTEPKNLQSKIASFLFSKNSH